MLLSIKKIISFNPSRVRLEAFIRRSAQNVHEQSLILDAGAGEGYYKTYFSGAKYHATDLCKVEKAYGRIHFISDLKNIPIQDKSYDIVLCTQVLEHLPQPERVLAELFRVLKPSGQLWFSAPLFFPEHEVPYDFFRYTRYGLKTMLESTGFEIQEIDWLEGYFGTLGFQLRVAARSLALTPFAYGKNPLILVFIPFIFLLKAAFLLLSFIFYFFELQTKFVGKGHGKNFCGVAVKPSCQDN